MAIFKEYIGEGVFSSVAISTLVNTFTYGSYAFLPASPVMSLLPVFWSTMLAYRFTGNRKKETEEIGEEENAKIAAHSIANYFSALAVGTGTAIGIEPIIFDQLTHVLSSNVPGEISRFSHTFSDAVGGFVGYTGLRVVDRLTNPAYKYQTLD